MPFMPTSFWERMASIVDDQEDKQQFTGSREARWILMQEGIDTFLDTPLTGVGAGQFKNYNPAGRRSAGAKRTTRSSRSRPKPACWGLLLFSFLIVRGAMAAMAHAPHAEPAAPARQADLLATVLTDERGARVLHAHSIGTTAALVGWFACAMFASVAYGWTFYYLLALIVAARELTSDRLAAARALHAPATRSGAARAAQPRRP